MIDRGTRGVGCRACDLLPDEAVREDVLDRLEPADGPTELLTPLGILRSELLRSLGDSQQEPRCQGRPLAPHPIRQGCIADHLTRRQ